MPRTSRTVAQRLAAQSKSRKRRTQRVGASPSASVTRVLDEGATVNDGAATAPPPGMLARPRPSATAPTATTGRTRRPYSEYGAEYAYVWTDLRRIGVIAGSLLVLLVLLTFVIR